MTLFYAKDALWSDPLANRNAGNKARCDVEVILEELGWKALPVSGHEVSRNGGIIAKISTHFSIEQMWNQALGSLSRGDVLFLQFPLVNHTLLFDRVLKGAKRRGVATIALVHDLEMLRAAFDERQSIAARARINKEEMGVLRLCDAVIAHNDSMKEALVERLGLDAGKVIALGVFDYLHDGELNNSRFDKDAPMAVCGSLREEKAGYLYSLADKVELNLYGEGYAAPKSEKIHCFGSYAPEQLVDEVKGSFGLVWDGPSTKACVGVYGNYLKVNNPHKVSMYLAAGMPVAIWDEAALAPFVTMSGVGITGCSIEDLAYKAHSLTQEQYDAMKENAKEQSLRVRTGFHTGMAVHDALGAILDGGIIA